MTLKSLSLENDMEDMRKTAGADAGNGSGLRSHGGANGKRAGESGMLGLISENIRRKIWLPILGLMVMLFAYPVNMGLQLSYQSNRFLRLANGAADSAKLAADKAEAFSNCANEILLGEYSFLVLIIPVAAVLCALAMFGYVYSRRQVDFYNSQPVSKERRFAAAWLSGVLIMLFCLIAGIAAAFIVAVFYNVTGIMYREMIAVNAGFMLVFLFLYSVAAVVVMLTGSKVGFFGLGLWTVIFAYVLSGAVMVLSSYYFDTGSGPEDFVRTVLMKFSPAAWLIEYYSCISALVFEPVFGRKLPANGVEFYSGKLMIAIAVSVAGAVIFTGLGFVLFKKRASETAGNAISFRIIKRPVRIAISVVMGLVFSLFGTVYDNTFWIIFFAFMGTLMTHAVIEIVYAGDIKAILFHKAEKIICIVLSILVICIFKFDVFGYDSFLPDPSKVDKVVIASSDFLPYRKAVDESREALYGNDGNRIYYNTSWNEEKGMARLDTPEEIEAAAKLIAGSNEYNGKDNNSGEAYEDTDLDREPLPSEEFDSRDHYISFLIIFKSGAEEYRHYTVPGSVIREYLEPIAESESFKEDLFPILGVRGENMGLLGLDRETGSVKVSAYGNDMFTYTLSGEAEEINSAKGEEAARRVLAALQQDLRELDFDDMLDMDAYNSYYYSDSFDPEKAKEFVYADLIYVPYETAMNVRTAVESGGISLREFGGYDISEDYIIGRDGSMENTRRALEELGY